MDDERLKQAENLRLKADRLEREVKSDRAAAVLIALTTLEPAINKIGDWDLTDGFETVVGQLRYYVDRDVAPDRATLLRMLFPGAQNIDAAAELIKDPESEERPWE